MTIEITWKMRPIVVAECTGELGSAEAQYKFGRCAIRVYRDRFEASQDGRVVALSHMPVRLQQSAHALRQARAAGITA